jgi:hypothetical protein
MKKLRIILVYVLFLVTYNSYTQSIPIEIFAGDNYLQTNIVVSKSIFKDSKFGILNVSGFDSHYDNKNANSSVMVTEVNYNVFKKISLGIGMTYNSVSGLSPTIGAGYNNFGRRHGITIAPGISLSSDTSYRIIANFSYKPKLSNKWSLYLASNNLLTYRFSGDHVRSFQKLRVGLDYNTFQFGFGVNFDQFGAIKISKNNTGVFVRKQF